MGRIKVFLILHNNWNNRSGSERRITEKGKAGWSVGFLVFQAGGLTNVNLSSSLRTAFTVHVGINSTYIYTITLEGIACKRLKRENNVGIYWWLSPT